MKHGDADVVKPVGEQARIPGRGRDRLDARLSQHVDHGGVPHHDQGDICTDWAVRQLTHFLQIPATLF